MVSKSFSQNATINDSSSPKAGAQRECSRHLGVSDTKEFLGSIGGRATRWPLLVGISLLAVCLIGYSASRIMFAKALASPTAVEQSESASDAEGAIQADDRQSVSRAFSFSFQSEAEAAVEHDYSSKPASQKPNKSSETSEKAMLHSQVHALLKSASDAVRSENLESFLALMDENEESLIRKQKFKAKIAFRQFDEIDGAYTNVKIEKVNANELAVNLHCEVDATYTKSGRRIALFNGDQHITLRRTAGAEWKICSIEKL
jgi:hypothetical protein